MNTQDENERRVKLALMLSAEMLKNGGETYRAEDCALRVLAAAGSADTQVMAMPTNILVTATFDGQTITRSRSVRVRAVDLGEIDRLNTVSRAYASGMLDLEGAMAAVSAASPPRPVWLMSLYACLSAAFLTCIFGGSWREFPFAALIAFASQFAVRCWKKAGKYGFMTNLFCSVFTAVCARLLALAVPSLNIGALIIGGIMPLLPGLSMTNAIRDTINGDLVSARHARWRRFWHAWPLPPAWAWCFPCERGGCV